METQDLFGAADAAIARMEENLAEAKASGKALSEAVEAALSAGSLSADGVRSAKALAVAEASGLSSLPGIMEAVVRALDAAKAGYLPSRAEAEEAAKARTGLAAAFGWSRRRKAAEAPPPENGAMAQAAYAGRVERLDRGARTVDAALESIPGRRIEMDALVFRLQEMAVAMGGASARKMHPVEDMASALLAHSEALALHSRLLSSVDRTGDESHAVAMEAHMDGLLGNEGL